MDYNIKTSHEEEKVNPPTLTVLMPTFNAGRYIKKSITSILSQNFTDFELLIIDDNSTDDTIEIIGSFLDPRIRIIRNPNRQGVIVSRNQGIQSAKGKYVAMCDSDDISTKNRFNLQISYIMSHRNCGIVCSFVDIIDESEKILKPWHIDRVSVHHNEIWNILSIENCIANSTVLMEKDLLLKYGYNPNDKDAEDYGLWLRLAAEGYQFCKIPDPLVYYRSHKDSITSLSKSKNPIKKVMNVKIGFLKDRFTKGNFSFFECRVAFFLLNDIISYVKFWYYKD